MNQSLQVLQLYLSVSWQRCIFTYCRYKMWWIARFHHPLSPVDSTSTVWLQPTFLLCLSPISSGQVQLLAVPLASLVVLTFGWCLAAINSLPFPDSNGLILLLGHPYFHLLESHSWKLSSKSPGTFSVKTWLFMPFLSSLWSVNFAGRVLSCSFYIPPSAPFCDLP